MKLGSKVEFAECEYQVIRVGHDDVRLLRVKVPGWLTDHVAPSCYRTKWAGGTSIPLDKQRELLGNDYKHALIDGKPTDYYEPLAVGDRVVMCGNEYVLAATDDGWVTPINPVSGHRWASGAAVSRIDKISRPEAKSLLAWDAKRLDGTPVFGA